MMTHLRRKVLTFALALMTILALARAVPAHAADSGTVLASSSTTSLLQFPEGLTSWQGKVYVATYNVNSGASNHILVFDASTGKLLKTLGDHPGQQDISAGPINGLTIDQTTGDLYAAANGIGYILRIHNPNSPNAQVSRFSHCDTNHRLSQTTNFGFFGICPDWFLRLLLTTHIHFPKNF